MHSLTIYQLTNEISVVWNYVKNKIKFRNAEKMKNSISFWQTQYYMLKYIFSSLNKLTKESLKTMVLPVSVCFFFVVVVMFCFSNFVSLIHLKLQIIGSL